MRATMAHNNTHTASNLQIGDIALASLYGDRGQSFLTNYGRYLHKRVSGTIVESSIPPTILHGTGGLSSVANVASIVKCGYYCSDKGVRLTQECQIRPPNAQRGRLRRLLQGKSKNPQWPRPEGAKFPAG